MPPAQAKISYPGIGQIMSWTIPVAHGITPGVFTFDILPQRDFPDSEGDLTLTYGDGVEITWPNCKVDSTGFKFDDSGFILSVTIFDRRWQWIFGSIEGDYNIRRTNNVIWDETIKTPQQLAKLCLEAMGEKDYDVSAMPNDSQPEKNWAGIAPAHALQELVEELGCRVVLDLDNSVKICIEGEGAPLPQGNNVMYYSPIIDIPEAPDRVRILCGNTRYQFDLFLEAVGIDADGSIQPIDKLLYKPKGGWDFNNLPDFTGLPETVKLPDNTTVNGSTCRDKARQSVLRYFRVSQIYTKSGLQKIGNAIIDGVKVKDLKQILPLENEQVDRMKSESDFAQNQYVNRPAWVFGLWYDDRIGKNVTPANWTTSGKYPTKPEPPKNASDPQIYNAEKYDTYTGSTEQRGFTLQGETGLVVFSEPIYLITYKTMSDPTTAKKTAPQLILRCAFSVRDEVTFAYQRYNRDMPTGFTFGTEPQTFKHDEIVRSVAMSYGKGYGSAQQAYDTTVNPTPDAVNTNKECDYYLKAAIKQYQFEKPEIVTLIGIVPVSPDGAIQQVVFSGDTDKGFETQIHRNNETHPACVPYEERMLTRRLSSVEATRQKIRQGIKQQHTLDFRPP